MEIDEVDLPETDAEVEGITAEQLRERMKKGDEVTVVDTRKKKGFEKWKIEGESVESINVPYTEFLEGEIDDDVLARIPDDRLVTAVCAKGKSSEFVAGMLAERGYEVEHLEDGMEGWASVYEAVEVERYRGKGTLIQYQRPSSGCLAYMVYEGDEAVVIDPLRAFADKYIEDAQERDAELVYAVDTHVHADHISGVRALDGRGVEGVVPEPAVGRGVTYADELKTVEDGDVLKVGETDIEAVHTPGHTSGMTSYLIDDAFLATGDGLFVESVARPDLEEGDEGAPDAARRLHESLQERVLALDDDVLVGGAHYSGSAEPADDGTYTATVGELKERMDALSMGRDEFVETVLADMPPRPANYEDIIAVNLGQKEADDEEAFTLELGPNNCAASQEALAGD
jgi:glyoxylase-like metal-dependent hydrolase (beta-lactamase superfamily II)/rhodanese-related sulfurtransferase